MIKSQVFLDGDVWMIKSQIFVVVETYYDGCNGWETTVKAFADKDEAEYHALELQEAFDATIPTRPKYHKGFWGEDRNWAVKTLDVY
jgi:hypothetical protein